MRWLETGLLLNIAMLILRYLCTYMYVLMFQRDDSIKIRIAYQRFSEIFIFFFFLLFCLRLVNECIPLYISAVSSLFFFFIFSLRNSATDPFNSIKGGHWAAGVIAGYSCCTQQWQSQRWWVNEKCAVAEQSLTQMTN